MTFSKNKKQKSVCSLNSKCAQLRFDYCVANNYLLWAPQLIYILFFQNQKQLVCNHLIKITQKKKKDDDDDDDGCSRRASLQKDFYRRNLFWVDASQLSLRLQPLHIARVYRRVFFECVSTSAVDKHLHRQTDSSLPACLPALSPPTDWRRGLSAPSDTHCLFASFRVFTTYLSHRVHVWLRAVPTVIYDSLSHVVSTDAHTENLFPVTGQQCGAFVWSTPREIKVCLRSKTDTDTYFLHLLCASFLEYPASLWKLSKHSSTAVNCGGAVSSNVSKTRGWRNIWGFGRTFFSKDCANGRSPLHKYPQPSQTNRACRCNRPRSRQSREKRQNANSVKCQLCVMSFGEKQGQHWAACTL